jgi:RNA polymerase sigma-70 factor (ECF subfamily)
MGVSNTGPSALLMAHDVELAALSASGDRRAFSELVRRHGSAVRSLLRRMGAAPALADDVAQDAFLTGFEQITEFRGEGTFQAWTKRIAARAYARRWRREQRSPRAEVALEPPAETPALASGQPDLDDALAGLSAPERLCVAMCYGAGLSHAETADALNLPLAAVKSHVRRGLDQLRRRLAPPPGDGVGDSRGRGHG